MTNPSELEGLKSEMNSSSATDVATTPDGVTAPGAVSGEGGLYPELPQPLRSHAHYIKAALSTYDGGPAAQDVSDAWVYILGALSARDGFILGETWPEWFAVLHSHNIAVTVTGNIDKRWRGGPDYCEIHRTDGSTLVKKFGHKITPRDFFAPFPAESGANSPSEASAGNPVEDELKSLVDRLQAERDEATETLKRTTEALREATRLLTQYAREAGEAKGRLEMSEAAGIVDGWRDRAQTAERERDELRKALEKIERWFDEFPATGRTWGDEHDTPMSYGSVFGSDGERDYMRDVARQALSLGGSAAPVGERPYLSRPWRLVEGQDRRSAEGGLR